MLSYIVIKQLSKTYYNTGNTVIALKEVDLSFNDHGLYFIVGKSGSGKSTLLNILGGLVDTYEGTIILNNTNLKSILNDNSASFFENEVSFLFQEDNLIGQMRVKDNILLGVPQGKSVDTQIHHLFQEFDLPLSLLKQKTEELSGGQKIRVALVRNLLKSSKIILADEITGNLDEHNANEVMKYLKQASKTHLIIMVTHDMHLARLYGDEIISLKYGQVESIHKNQSLKEESYISNIEKNTQPVFGFKRNTNLGLFYLKRNLKQSIISFLLLMIALLSIITLSYFYRYDGINTIERYMSNTNYPYVLVQQEINSGGIHSQSTYLTKGKSLITGLDSGLNVMKLYLNEYASKFDMASPEGESSAVETSFMVYDTIQMPIEGYKPTLNSEVLISKALYQRLYEQNTFNGPIPIYTRYGMKTITGIIDTDQEQSVSLSFYELYYQYVVFTMDSSMIQAEYITTKTKDETTIYHYSLSVPISSGRLPQASNEIVISQLLSQLWSIGLDDQLNLKEKMKQMDGNYLDISDYYPENPIVVGISSSFESHIIHEENYFNTILNEYSSYYALDQVIVEMSDIQSTVQKVYKSAQIVEPGVLEIDTQNSFIHQVRNLLVPIILLIIVLLVIASIVVSTGVLYKRNREIGILRLLSAKTKDIIIIINIQVSVLFIISTMISYVISLMWVSYLNQQITLYINQDFEFFKFDLLGYILVMVASLILLELSTFIVSKVILRKSIFENIIIK